MLSAQTTVSGGMGPTRVMDRDLVAECPWCDTLGRVDGRHRHRVLQPPHPLATPGSDHPLSARVPSLDGVVQLQPPSRVMLTGPGAVRWAARSEDGRRSLTWRIRGTTNKAGKDEVYTGTRQTMGDVKLSLHQADPANGFDNASILAFTKEFAEATNLPKRPMATTPRTI